MNHPKRKDPYELVAEALGCDRSTLTVDSAWNVHELWDSFAQVRIIVALEEEYGMKISESEVEDFGTMARILERYRALEKDECPSG